MKTLKIVSAAAMLCVAAFGPSNAWAHFRPMDRQHEQARDRLEYSIKNRDEHLRSDRFNPNSIAFVERLVHHMSTANITRVTSKNGKVYEIVTLADGQKVRLTEQQFYVLINH